GTLGLERVLADQARSHGASDVDVCRGARLLLVALSQEWRFTTVLNMDTSDESKLLDRITIDPRIFGGKPIIRGRRLAVEHVLGMLAAGDTPETILEGYPWLEPEDIRACLVYAWRHVGHERIELLTMETVP